MATSFLEDAARTQAAEAVAAIESQTAAEVVVAVRRASSDYAHTDARLGAAVAFVVLGILLFIPQEVHLYAFPPVVLLSYAAGVMGGRLLPSLRRALTPRKLQEDRVRTAAKAAFTELGVSHTSRRTGILVFVSLLERRVEVVTDYGVDPSLMGAEWQEALTQLSSTIAASPAPEPFFQALRRLQAPLSRVLPRLEDDVNELPDMPGAVA
ncbi:TPM domain-containing protein [Corallococcus interemptor]|uniref:TPM domain-containing protein n=1 Tax=Corallococcus interemptor TaxID=2316720 RepID=UPI003D0568DB